MTVEAYAAFGALIVAVIGITLRVGYVLNRKVSYESLDRCKNELLEMFVHKDVFAITVAGIKEDVGEIKKDVKELLRRKTNGSAG